ncbi:MULTISPECIES: MFS transporter [Pseudomonas]|uniref:MFS transporter n=8 Tax=Pseudomonas TaxID=286 RepID=A0AAJ4E417_PSESX|nr:MULTISPECIES: MFS transporter [Pseudomonas]MCW6054487.1 MFS transporter [Pseudomonas fragi]AAY36634.1 Phospholipid/glycerol acyltransferase:Phospholipid/glycerol acyltransferase [Pseudomonas syringae pv. syringae B728a]AKF45057.1 1-acyl-sn-glycerol-3-phosphate acyltransferase [Pseudomonas syringae pv. syringae B301D]EGH74178.1 phospholipid/glycerol acyltransferase:phospholipid/glycerol acyltransferase [Pseudomonas syringae pv. aceris str. M302273]EXL30454.1 putative 2-acyl-glycerophospho-et
MSQQSQFSLLGKRRFLPFFITQSLGAFNDNVFKQSLILAILYKLSIDGDRSIYVNLCALLFILPFFLFSALAGQFGEKYPKDKLIRIIKFGEIVIMVVGAAGFLFNHLELMLAALFAMGTHSALFGPVKYSILPQHLRESELVGGNALVEMGTFLAILAGTISAGVMMSSSQYAWVVAAAIVLVACLGFLASFGIPRAEAASPEMKLNWNIFTQSWATLRMGLGQTPAVSRSIVGNSWFWFVGAIYLTQIPAYAKEWMYGDETVVTLILAVFSIGIALGSLLCERLSGHKVEIGLVPFGSMGLTIFGLLLWWHSGGFPQNVQANDWLAVLSSGQGWLVLFDILGIGVFGGFYIVPLYALIQSRTPLKERSRVIAANNILNALFMVVSAIVSILLLSVAKLSIPQLFLAVSVMNIAVNIYIFKIVPEFTMRFMIWLLGHSMYRVEHRNLDRIPDEGAALLVCNHVSFVDALLIAGAVRRPIRFVMYYKIYQLPVLNFIFRTAGTIPIAGRNEDMDIYETSFKRIAQYLAEGELVCIFPEGKLTTDGEINGFKNGMSRIIQETPVPVIPLALQGLWGSFFSRDPSKTLFRRLWSRVVLVAGSPIAADVATPVDVREEVKALRGKVQ